jgi:hypothetical protein
MTGWHNSFNKTIDPSIGIFIEPMDPSINKRNETDELDNLINKK